MAQRAPLGPLTTGAEVPGGFEPASYPSPPTLIDSMWADVIAEAGVIEAPFVLGPPIEESEVLRGARRPLTAGGRPGIARATALEQVDAAARRALELAGE